MASIIIAALLLIAVYVGTRRLSGLQILGVMAVTALGIALAAFPDLSTDVARRLGVGRGTDLVFYFALLAGMFCISNLYFRFKKQEEILVELIRQNAIDHAEAPTP
jgi:small membrane protein